MGDLTKRFSEDAKRVVALSLASAKDMGHSYVGSEHLLLGILAQRDSTPSRLLFDCGCRFEDVKAKVVSIIGMGAKSGLTGEDMTPVCKKILMQAAFLSKQWGCRLTGSEHLLASLLREDCVGARILEDFGVEVSELYDVLANLYSSNAAEKTVETAFFCERSEEYSKKSRPTPLLDKNAVDLTKKASKGQLDPVIGRQKEEEQLIGILLRRSKNNPVLIGEAGVGKTAIVESVARRIASGEVPRELTNTRIMSLELSSVVAGTKYRGEFEEKIKGIVDEVRQAGDVVLFVDEIHTMVGAGAAEGAIDASNILKPALARGEIRLIGATTPKEYRQTIEGDGALARRFQPVTVCEPTEEECAAMLFGLRDRYEKFHDLTITDGAVTASVSLSKRFIAQRFLPDKAIDLLDEAAAKKKMHRGDNPCLLDERDVALLVEEKTGIPTGQGETGGKNRFLNLEEELKKNIVGQDSAIRSLCSAVMRSRASVRDGNRPWGTFLFLGSPGVGKTECAKALAKAVFCRKDAFVRLDMGEFTEPHSVSKLIGAPPGYKGYGEGGFLTERIKRNPYSLVLFDEVEKAHADVRALLLRLLDEGCLTDSSGVTVSFCDAVVILTANTSFPVAPSIGFCPQEETKERERAVTAAKKILSPELVDRIDETVLFLPLGSENVCAIAESKLREMTSRLENRGIKVCFDDGFVKSVISFCGATGARGAVMSVIREAENAISRCLLTESEEKSECEMTVFFKNGQSVAKISQNTY